MKVNNVRAALLTGGDLFDDNIYIFPYRPEETQVSAICNAGIWAGGMTSDGNVKLSGITYRKSGFDYSTGPLDREGNTNFQVCSNWDKIFTVTGNNIYLHIHNFKNAKILNQPFDCDKIPADVKFWPAQGNPFWMEKYKFPLPDQPLANYYDYNSDGLYNPCDGDYPLQFSHDCHLDYHNQSIRIPDEINYFIFNDAGSVHSLTNPNYLGMEYHANVYAYRSDDDLNNMTFYTYKTIYKGTESIKDFYFGLFVHSALGCNMDDFFGYDVARSMAYVYNADDFDGFTNAPCSEFNTYGSQIPVVGIDFLKGPQVMKAFVRDESGNIIYGSDGQPLLQDLNTSTMQHDTIVEIPVKSFNHLMTGIPVFFPNSLVDEGLYRLLKCPVFGNDTLCFRYTDYPDIPGGNSMCGLNFNRSNGIMMISTGPTALLPGSSQMISFGIVGVENVKHPCPDLTQLKFADDYAQSLFDLCFRNTCSGPDAPDLDFKPEDQCLKIQIINHPASNNYNESYIQTIRNVAGEITYKFEGYKIYQLAHEDVPYSELNNPDLARIVYQSDIKNEVQDLYNWSLVSDKDPDAPLPYRWTKFLKVSGSNKGITHSITLTEDLFAKEDKEFLFGKTYYYTVVAYAAGSGQEFDPMTGKGLQKSYIESTQNLRKYTFTPKLSFQNNGSVAQITRISGSGNPHIDLALEHSMYDKILSGNPIKQIRYLPGYGPLLIRVNEPDKLVRHRYRVTVEGSFDFSRELCNYRNDARWKITDVTTGETLAENIPLHSTKEINLKEQGFSIWMPQFPEPGENYNYYNGGISATLEYKNSTGPEWFEGITAHTADLLHDRHFSIIEPHPTDPKSRLSRLGEGYFFPMRYVRSTSDPEFPLYVSPSSPTLLKAATLPTTNYLRIRDINNVDIIFTSDKSKWSKCVVVEATSPFYTDGGLTTIGDAKHFEVRRSPSIDQNGNPLNDNTFGFSYFPGYAVDVETGKRLNIFFGEASVFHGINSSLLEGDPNICSDMIFNPSTQIYADAVSVPLKYVAGGHHYIYVTREDYDGCRRIGQLLRNGGSQLNKVRTLAAITWTAIPLLNKNARFLSLANGLIPNDLIVKLRVDNPYGQSRIFSLDRERDCITDGQNPVYEFEFVALSHVTDLPQSKALNRIGLYPNPARLLSDGFTAVLSDMPEGVEIRLLDINGNVVEVFDEKTTSDATGGMLKLQSKKSLRPGLYFFQVSHKASGETRLIKWLIL
jgi:hypothetical protein